MRRRGIPAILLLGTLFLIVAPRLALADQPPVVTAPATASGAPNTLITFMVLASDPDGDPINSLTAAPLPSGATFTTNASFTAGTFAWTPPASQGSTTINLTTTASNVLSGSAVTVVTVFVTDRAPVVTAPATAGAPENSLVNFTVTASDPDGDAIANLLASGPAITAGGTFTRTASFTAGTFSWTPTFTQSGVYGVTFTATNALSGAASTQITITDVDRAPIVTAPATASGVAGNPITFTVFASDPDGNPITSLAGGPLPSGAAFVTNASNTAGTFNWTPTTAQAGNYSVTFTASNALSGSATTAIFVSPSESNAPVVTAPATVSGAANALITFPVTAIDPNGDPITTFTASGTAITAGGSFTTNASNTSGTFSWTPTNAQLGTFSVTFTAANALSGTATTFITVGDDRAPVVTAPATASTPENALLTFTVNASDPDGDAILSLTAAGSAITGGGTFTANASNTSGTFSWTPNFTQAGNYAVTFTASNALSGAATTTISVGGPGRPPVVLAPATASAPPNAPMSFTVSAADPDGEAIVSLTAAPLPSGATFTSNAAHTSGTFAWTPTNAQLGTYSVTFTASNTLSGSATTAITVTASDRPPIVSAPATATFGENVFGSFTVSASDPDGEAINSLTATGTVLTAGASFVSNASHTSGTLSWTPSFGQLGSYSATFTAANALTGSASTAITVAQIFTPPVVTAPATVTGSEGTLISFTVTASDPDDAIISLTATPLPPGATFSTNATHTSGTFSWTPTFSQAGTYNVTFLATNSLSGSATTAITVQDVCQPPVADAGGPYTGAVNAPISLDGSGTTGSASSYQWDFGDGTTGTGITVTHIYVTAGTYTVTLTVTGSCGTSSDVTTVTLGQFCAFAFTSGGNKNLRLDSGKPSWCAQVQPVPGCYANSDVVLSSIALRYNGGEIHANTGKSAVSGDVNKDGIEEITACFTKTDLRQLFAGLPAGENQITASIAMDLVSGGQVSADLTIRVFSSGPALAASVMPNPFNPRATLSFRTSREGFARARLFDSTGRLVRTLMEERSLAAGYHEVPLDGRNQTGGALSSGIYLYRVETAEGTVSGRVVLLK